MAEQQACWLTMGCPGPSIAKFKRAQMRLGFSKAREGSDKTE